MTTQPTPPGTTRPAPGIDIPDRAERERRNAALHAANAETGFFDDHGRPATWPDDIETWTLDSHQHSPDPAHPSF
ncbi:hypothetical protein [Actinoplanes sichuanensis]|uniref:Uncharacterized protein n=1 Tax=Actinoplanes sichuanensis TaxID=512349 RepID=A0ABW4A1I0_9ACTN